MSAKGAMGSSAVTALARARRRPVGLVIFP
jgi:hypothetical protein